MSCHLLITWVHRFARAHHIAHFCARIAGEEATDELLRQFVQDALIAKSNSGSTKLYDQCVGHRLSPKLAVLCSSTHSTCPSFFAA